MKNRSGAGCALVFVFAFFLLAGRAFAAPSVQVVASFSILADMARQIGGSDVQVSSLVGADGDAHIYQPSADDMKRIAKADVILVNGLGYDPWMDRLIEAAGASKTALTIAGAGITPRMMEEDGVRGTDPHAWQDLSNGQIYVKNIAAALEKAAPSSAASIRTRATAYGAEMAALDAQIKTAFGAVPAQKRKIITSHDAFGYFGAAYGVEFLAPQGVNTEAQASAESLAALVRQIRAEKVHVVFIENMTDPRLIQQLAHDTGAKMGGALYADSLSAQGGPAPEYLAMFRHNLKQIMAAFQ